MKRVAKTGSIPAHKTTKKVRTGYKPRPLQNQLHNNIKRFNVLVCHRRFGKTVLAVNEIIDRALQNPLRNPRYAYIAPTYKQAKKVAWQYFVDYTRFLPGVKVNKSELTIYIDRSGRVDPVSGKKDPDFIEISLIGADDPDSLRGIYLDGGAIDEYAQCDPIIWGQVIRPALADRKKIAYDQGIYEDYGGTPLIPWVIFIGTPKGQNHFYFRYKKAQDYEKYCREYVLTHDIRMERREWRVLEEKFGITEETTYKDAKAIIETWSPTLRNKYDGWRSYKAASQWYTTLLKASETGVLDRDEIDEMMADMSKEEVEQELECSFTAAILGSYYGHIINKMREDGRVGDVPYNPKYPVDTYWDIGISDKLGIWFTQKIGKRAVHYIDYYEINGKGIEEIKAVIDAKANFAGASVEVAEDERIKGRGFRYGRHVWPHDGAAREFGTGVTRQETARRLGLIVEIQTKQAIDDRISASRLRFKISSIDEKNCERGIDCLYNYQKEWDAKLLAFKNKPKHDWSSHGADSFGYSCLDDRPSFFPDDPRGRFGNLGDQEFADTDYDEMAA